MTKINLIARLKNCPKRGRWKDRLEFSRNRSRRDGLSTWCRGRERAKHV